MTTYSADVADRYYGPPEPTIALANQHPILRCDIFYPNGTMPVGGWPCVIYSSMSDFVAGSKSTAVSPTKVMQHEILEKGMALVWANLPVARGGASPNGVGPETFDPDFDVWGAAYGGNGCMPESTSNSSGAAVVWPGPFPSGYIGTPHPWLDPAWLNSSKAAMWLVQHLRYHGIGGPGPMAEKLDLHPGRIGCFGESASAISFTWPAYQPNRAGLTGDPSPQGQMSTRLNAGAFRRGLCDWIVMANAAPPNAHMFPQKPSVAGDSLYDKPAAAQGDVDDSPFNTRGFSGADWFGGFGGLNFGGDLGDSGVYLLNKAFKSWWSSDVAMNATLLTTNSRYVTAVSNLETDLDSVYQAYRVKARLPDNTTLVVEDAGAVDATPETGGGVPADKTIFTGDADVYEDAALFLQTNLELDVPVEEVVIQKLESVLAAITFANGSTTDVKAVYRFEDLPDDVVKAPCIMIDAMDTLYDDGFTNRHMRKTLALDITLFLEGWKDQMARLSSFLADVEKALYADETLGALIENLHINRGRRHLLNPEMHEYAVAELTVDLIFRHHIGDPFNPFVST